MAVDIGIDVVSKEQLKGESVAEKTGCEAQFREDEKLGMMDRPLLFGLLVILLTAGVVVIFGYLIPITDIALFGCHLGALMLLVYGFLSALSALPSKEGLWVSVVWILAGSLGIHFMQAVFFTFTEEAGVVALGDVRYGVDDGAFWTNYYLDLPERVYVDKVASFIEKPVLVEKQSSFGLFNRVYVCESWPVALSRCGRVLDHKELNDISGYLPSSVGEQVEANKE